MAKSALRDQPIAAVLTEEWLDDFAVERMLKYGTEVIEDRALADFRDGLKPVHRKILWSMHKENMRSSGPTKKAARVVGDVMGKYHPHGDQAIYGAAVTMGNLPRPLIASQGNFGFFNGNPASMRYTEIRLAKYSEQILLAPEYLAITQMMPNYDGEESEPIHLPALLPNLLINGVSGIAVGVVTNIPPFEIKGIVKLLQRAYKNQNISVKDCARYLRISYPAPFNSKVLTSEQELLEFYRTGEGRLLLGVDYEVDGNQMIIDKFPPYFDMGSAKNKLVERVPEVARADEISEGENKIMRVILKTGIPIMDRGKIFERCAELLDNGINLRINYIRRIDANHVEFGYCNMPELIMRWVKWRITLEKKMQRYVLAQLRATITRLQLMILAYNNLSKIFTELRRRTANLEQRLATVLDISLEQAETIARMQVRSLSALSYDNIVAEIKKHKRQVKQTKQYIQHPAQKILADLATISKI
ncbi:MAG TPA: DNA gyrase subunit A [Nitrosopumilaceae archaeon]|nr:DNA gyrase subunit A [Nitrosopumilaceae archaeon]